MLVNQKDHLSLFPADEWAAIEGRLLEMSSLNPEAQRLQRFYAAGSISCPIDQQGRILVPGFLREHADLGSKVVIAGVLERIEIWNPTKYETGRLDTVHDFDELQRTVDQSSRS